MEYRDRRERQRMLDHGARQRLRDETASRADETVLGRTKPLALAEGHQFSAQVAR